MGQVAEGVRNAKSVRDLAKKLGVEMPITETVYRILYEGLSPQGRRHGADAARDQAGDVAGRAPILSLRRAA